MPHIFLMQNVSKLKPTNLLPPKNNFLSINVMTCKMSWLSMKIIWWISWCLPKLKVQHGSDTILRTSTPPHKSCYLCSWTNNQIWTLTYVWYWNSWRIRCLQVSISLIHCCQKGWPSQTNLWPLLTWQMHKIKKSHPWNFAMNLWIQAFYQTWYLNAIWCILTGWIVLRKVWNHCTFWKIKIQISAFQPKVCP